MILKQKTTIFNKLGYEFVKLNKGFDGEDVKGFKNYWNNMPDDKYIRSNFKYRRRRYSKFEYDSVLNEMTNLGATYFQTKEHNHIYGGHGRDFDPVRSEFLDDPLFRYFLDEDCRFFREHHIVKERKCPMGVHLMRTTSDVSNDGIVTPEGIHKDGHYAFAIHMIDRNNVAGGATNLYDNSKVIMVSRTLDKFGETLFVEDDKLYHDVSPISNVDKRYPGTRDVLIIEFY